MRDRTFFLAFLLLSWGGPALAVDAIGQLEGPEGGGWVVEHEEAARKTIALGILDKPGVTAARYALRGELKCEGVAARSYLEMWSVFGQERYFSRSLAPEGPVGIIVGDQDWRRFVLPFFNTLPGAPPPDRIELKLVMAGPGRVEIRDVELVQFGDGENPLQEPGAWLSPRQVGLFGGLLGGLFGLAGALIGILSTRARARALVILLLASLAFVGLAGLALGVAASFQGQPWHVCFLGFLLGVIGLGLPLGLGRRILRRYKA